MKENYARKMSREVTIARTSAVGYRLGRERGETRSLKMYRAWFTGKHLF